MIDYTISVSIRHFFPMQFSHAATLQYELNSIDLRPETLS